jgi:hypothetical protein
MYWHTMPMRMFIMSLHCVCYKFWMETIFENPLAFLENFMKEFGGNNGSTNNS